jgi:hypothetical protein
MEVGSDSQAEADEGLLAFLVDILLFVPHLGWGGWIVLVATIILTSCGVGRRMEVGSDSQAEADEGQEGGDWMDDED